MEECRWRGRSRNCGIGWAEIAPRTSHKSSEPCSSGILSVEILRTNAHSFHEEFMHATSSPESSITTGAKPMTDAKSQRVARHWTDWVGFFVFAGLALQVVRGSGSLGIMMLPTLLHELVIAYLFLTRSRARRTLTGW